jgi:D-arabinono-1,4-lactone oxidase
MARMPFSSKGLWVHAPIEVRVTDTSRPASLNASQPRPFLDNTCKTEPTLYLNATLYRPYMNEPPCHKRYYEAFEWLMKDLGGKPHWAKNFAYTSREDIEGMYGADLDGWRRVRESVDPEGLFVGSWLRRTVLPALKEEGGQAERLPLEEKEVHVRKNWKAGGLSWSGEQQPKSAVGEKLKDNDSDETVPPSASSQESFDVMHEAEASTVLRHDDEGEDDGTVIAARVRENAQSGLTGVKMFEKM